MTLIIVVVDALVICVFLATPCRLTKPEVYQLSEFLENIYIKEPDGNSKTTLEEMRSLWGFKAEQCNPCGKASHTPVYVV